MKSTRADHPALRACTMIAGLYLLIGIANALGDLLSAVLP